MKIWIHAGLVAALGVSLAGCGTEGSRVTLTEIERMKRDTDRQMRLVREQNLTLNEKLNRINARLDVIVNEYVPAVTAALDSVTSREQVFKTDLVNEVEDRLAVMNDGVRTLRNELAQEMAMQGKAVTDQVRDNMEELQFRLDDVEGFVHYVATRQDSVNQSMIGRVDRKAGYTPFLSGWAGSGGETAGPSF